MTVQASVDQSITRQAARLRALKKIKGVLEGLADEDALEVMEVIAALYRAIENDAEPQS